ncbi:universal stress protein [Nocardioides rubriscoriae]|uniref:universal stress protein n=1 Tax=Nocardioides rubriscoriae TaxID=642762 RepID=UPI0011DFA15C|nr:universal stress protein [Nocardioides rubriscoriae]
MTIVTGYTPDATGLAAVDHAIGLARSTGETLVVVNTGVRGSDADASFAGAKDWDALDQRLAALGLAHEMHQPAHVESPALEILATAERTGATQIVIGVRRRSAVGKLFLGSVAQQVILEATCPVVAVKQPT